MKQNFVCKWIALCIFGMSQDLGPASLIGFSWVPTHHRQTPGSYLKIHQGSFRIWCCIIWTIESTEN